MRMSDSLLAVTLTAILPTAGLLALFGVSSSQRTKRMADPDLTILASCTVGTSYQDVWSGAPLPVPLPGVVEPLEFSSTSPLDTGPMLLYGLNAQGGVCEDLVMAPGDSSGESFLTLSGASIGSPAHGTVAIKGQASSTIFGIIQPGKTAAGTTAYTVPDGHKLYITQVLGISHTQQATGFLLLVNGNIRHAWLNSQSDSFEPVTVPVLVGAADTVWIQAWSGYQNVPVTAGFSGRLGKS